MSSQWHAASMGADVKAVPAVREKAEAPKYDVQAVYAAVDDDQAIASLVSEHLKPFAVKRQEGGLLGPPTQRAARAAADAEAQAKEEAGPLGSMTDEDLELAELKLSEEKTRRAAAEWVALETDDREGVEADNTAVLARLDHEDAIVKAYYAEYGDEVV